MLQVMAENHFGPHGMKNGEMGGGYPKEMCLQTKHLLCLQTQKMSVSIVKPMLFCDISIKMSISWCVFEGDIDFDSLTAVFEHYRRRARVREPIMGTLSQHRQNPSV